MAPKMRPRINPHLIPLKILSAALMMSLSSFPIFLLRFLVSLRSQFIIKLHLWVLRNHALQMNYGLDIPFVIYMNLSIIIFSKYLLQQFIMFFVHIDDFFGIRYFQFRLYQRHYV